MEQPPPPSDLDDEGPWVGLFVLLPVLAVVAVVALLGWRWHRSSTVEAALRVAADTSPVAAKGQVTRRAVAPPPARPAPTAGGLGLDAGPPMVLTLKTLQSMFDVSKLLHRNAAEAAANVERYCAEAAKLPKHVFDDPPDAGPLRDAAYFMEPLVTWETHPPTEGLLELPKPLLERIMAASDDQLTVGDTAGIGFDWLAQLKSYDYWSLASVGAVADQATTVDPLMSPIPHYRLLVAYAKLRLVRALALGDLAEGFAEVQHLADIVHSNDIMLAQVYAARIVNIMHRFQSEAAQQGYPPLDASPAPLDAASYDGFRDLTMAAVAFTLPGVEDAVFERAMECGPEPCAAIMDAVAVHRELDRFSERTDDGPFWSFAQTHTCDLPMIDLLKTSPSGGLEQVAGWLGGEPLPLEKLFGPGIAGAVAK